MQRITGILLEDQYTIMIVCRSVVLRMRNISDTLVQRLKGGNPTTGLPSGRLATRPREWLLSSLNKNKNKRRST